MQYPQQQQPLEIKCQLVGNTPKATESCQWTSDQSLGLYPISIHSLCPTCDFELRCPSHQSGSILQFTGVISPVSLLYLRYPNMCGINNDGASPFNQLTLLTGDIGRVDQSQP